jgi:hypothetical protein
MVQRESLTSRRPLRALELLPDRFGPCSAGFLKSLVVTPVLTTLHLTMVTHVPAQGRGKSTSRHALVKHFNERCYESRQ